MSFSKGHLGSSPLLCKLEHGRRAFAQVSSFRLHFLCYCLLGHWQRDTPVLHNT